jgi:pSer/pThr/pTyr-binding forkhead associated (FHA) protein
VADDDRDKEVLEPTSKELSRGARAAEPVYWIEYRGDSIELRGGQLLVGRSAMCRLVLDDPLVSRQHAEFRYENGVVVLYDLKSVNGVFVNGQKVERQSRLVAGDRVSIGGQDLVLRSRATGRQGERSNERRFFAETMHEESDRQGPSDVSGSTLIASSEDSTIQGEGLDLLATVADKVLALRRGDDAERILATYLQTLLEKSRQGQICPPQTAEKAVTYAVKLASITAKANWVDYCIDFYNVIERPLPGSVIDALYDILRKISGVNLTALREYVATLHAVQSRLGPAEKFLVQRIEGLERLAALR